MMEIRGVQLAVQLTICQYGMIWVCAMNWDDLSPKAATFIGQMQTEAARNVILDLYSRRILTP